MKKILIKIIILLLAFQNANAQQLKRWTLSSQGKQKVSAPFRISWTVGGCPGCGTLQSPDGKLFLRQGFQQPPALFDNPANCSVTAAFNITPTASQTCGIRYDFEYNGSQVQGVIYTWDFGDGASPRTSNQANPVSISYSTSGLKIVSLTVKQGACSESISKSVTINPNQVGFSGNLGIANVKCFGDKSGSVSVTTTGGSGVKTYRWSNGNTASTISGLAVGRYQVTVMDANGCSINFDTAVTQPLSKMAFQVAIINESCKNYNDGMISLEASGGTAPYRYERSADSLKVGLVSLSAGIYPVTIKDAQGCKIDTSFEIKLRCKEPKNDKIFDTFSPNGDNVNETWVVKDIEKYPKNETILFNRWGQIVYNKAPYSNEWNGVTNDGKDLPAAAYYYVIRLNDDKGTVWTGSITLVR